MLSRIHDKGIKVCVWINPYIAQASELFLEGAEKGYFLHKENGDVWQWDKWQAGMAIVDFTNPEAKAWYQEKLTALLEMGVDCFKTDFGERIPDKNVRYFDGSDPKKMHNFYSYLYNETVYETIKRVKGEEDAVVFARSGTSGGQKFPVHWGGDCFDMGIGVMILAVLKIRLHRMFTRDGWHLDFYRVTQDFTEAVLIACRGFTMMRQQRYCVILFW